MLFVGRRNEVERLSSDPAASGHLSRSIGVGGFRWRTGPMHRSRPLKRIDRRYRQLGTQELLARGLGLRSARRNELRFTHVWRLYHWKVWWSIVYRGHAISKPIHIRWRSIYTPWR